MAMIWLKLVQSPRVIFHWSHSGSVNHPTRRWDDRYCYCLVLGKFIWMLVNLVSHEVYQKFKVLKGNSPRGCLAHYGNSSSTEDQPFEMGQWDSNHMCFFLTLFCLQVIYYLCTFSVYTCLKGIAFFLDFICLIMYLFKRLFLDF